MKFLNKFLEYKHSTVILSGLIFLCSLLTLHQFKQAESNLKESKSATKFAYDVITTNDLLEMYAKNYLTTKDEIWKTKYISLFNTRRGTEADATGEKKSLSDKLKDHDFNEYEVTLANSAITLSDKISADYEFKAFKSIEQYIEARKNHVDQEILLTYESMARTLLFSEQYDSANKEVTDIGQKFYNAVLTRLESDYKKSMTIAWVSIIATNISLILIVMIAVHHNHIHGNPRGNVRNVSNVRGTRGKTRATTKTTKTTRRIK